MPAPEPSARERRASSPGTGGAGHEVAARVADARRRAGLTLAAIAERTGLSPAYLSQIESGDANPTVRRLEQIAGALGVEFAAFLGARDPDPDQPFEAYLSPGALAAGVPGHPAVWDRTAPGSRRLTARLVHGSAADHAEAVTHDGEEFLVVLCGSCRLRVGAAVYELTAGDSCHYSARIEHQISRGSDDLTVSVVMAGTEPKENR